MFSYLSHLNWQLCPQGENCALTVALFDKGHANNIHTKHCSTGIRRNNQSYFYYH